jgi:hypothetical protein
MKLNHYGFLQVLFILLDWSVASNTGLIQFYSDRSCSNPAGVPESHTVDDCADAGSSKYLGVKVVSFPTCSSGQVFLEISDTKNCSTPSISPPVTTGKDNVCLTQQLNWEIASAGFVCRELSSSSSTITTPTSTNPIHTTTPTSTSDPSQTPVQGETGSRPYSPSDVIALGVGIGLGLPTFLVGAWVCCFGQVFLHYRFSGASRVSLERILEGGRAPPPYHIHMRPLSRSTAPPPYSP